MLTIILCTSGCIPARFEDTGSIPICCTCGDASDFDFDVRPRVEGVKIFLQDLIRLTQSRFALFRICFASQIGQPERQGPENRSAGVLGVIARCLGMHELLRR